MNAAVHAAEITLHERPVLRVCLPVEYRTEPCGDCGAEATVLIVEKRAEGVDSPKAWYWCGCCDIGG